MNFISVGLGLYVPGPLNTHACVIWWAMSFVRAQTFEGAGTLPASTQTPSPGCCTCRCWVKYLCIALVAGLLCGNILLAKCSSALSCLGCRGRR